MTVKCFSFQLQEGMTVEGWKVGGGEIQLSFLFSFSRLNFVMLDNTAALF